LLLHVNAKFSVVRYLLPILFVFGFVTATAQDTTGIRMVKCHTDTTQSYSIYFPNKYREDVSLPVIFLFDPAARGRLAVSLFKAAAEKLGIIVIASNNSRNGPVGLSLQAADAMFKDAFKNHHLDQNEIYLGGFSGGARVATAIAQNNPTVAGVIACSAGFNEQIPDSKIPWYFTGVTGSRDFNYIEMLNVHKALDSLRTPNNLIVFNGQHMWPPQDVIERALVSQYNHYHKIDHQKQYDDVGLPDKRRYQQELSFQSEVMGALQAIVYNRTESVKALSWWRAKQGALKRTLAFHTKADSDYVARQTSFILATTANEFENCYQAKQLECAEEVLNVAAIFGGTDPMIYYRYARLAALQKDENLAVSCLEQAVKNGLKDKMAIKNDRAFYFLRENMRFKAIVN
jgi:hypothetical protein